MKTFDVYHLKINSSDFVECQNTPEELRARTAIVAHLDMNALIFMDWTAGVPQKSTLFYPAYFPPKMWNSDSMEQMITNLNLESGEGVIYGTEQSYIQQPCIGLFPRSIERTKKLLNRWLTSNRRYLNDHESIKSLLKSHITSNLKRFVTDHENA